MDRKPMPSSRPPWLNLFKATARKRPHSFQQKPFTLWKGSRCPSSVCPMQRRQRRNHLDSVCSVFNRSRELRLFPDSICWIFRRWVINIGGRSAHLGSQSVMKSTFWTLGWSWGQSQSGTAACRTPNESCLRCREALWSRRAR